MIVMMLELREELTQALMEHLYRSARQRALKGLGVVPYTEAVVDELIDSLCIETWRQTAEDCMDFMYGEIAELYPDQLSCSGQSEGSAPPRDPQE